MNKEKLINIAKNFKIEGDPIKIEKCDSGHINKTYAITYKTKEGCKKYILQYVNTNVFPNLSDLMRNIKNITEYMVNKVKENGESTDRLTIRMIDTIDENPHSIYNKNWRMEEFIDKTKETNMYWSLRFFYFCFLLLLFSFPLLFLLLSLLLSLLLLSPLV